MNEEQIIERYNTNNRDIISTLIEELNTVPYGKEWSVSKLMFACGYECTNQLFLHRVLEDIEPLANEIGITLKRYHPGIYGDGVYFVKEKYISVPEDCFSNFTLSYSSDSNVDINLMMIKIDLTTITYSIAIRRGASFNNKLYKFEDFELDSLYKLLNKERIVSSGVCNYYSGSENEVLDENYWLFSCCSEREEYYSGTGGATKYEMIPSVIASISRRTNP